MVVIFVASLIEIFSKGVSYEVWNSLKVCDRQFIFGTVHLMIRNQKHLAINQFLKIKDRTTALCMWHILCFLN